MKITNTYWLIAINVLLVAYFAKGQTPITGKVIELETDHSNTQSWDYLGRDMVRLKPGFHYGAVAGKSFHAGIDKNLVLPTDYSSSLFTDATFVRNINTSLPVGKIPAKANITSTGGATYTIPIYTPLGTAGMVPSLSINYNSQAGNGLLGMGWNLAGISSITRVNKTLYHDNEVSAINYTASDRFALDDNRLMAIAGTTTYRTEIETFSLVTAKNALGTGPESFEVETKEGLTMEYGNTSDSRLLRDPANGPEVIAWYINKINDNYGNYITFVYANDADGFRIQEINYTGNAAHAPYNNIKFYYDRRTDKNSFYIAGEVLKNNTLLREIGILCEGHRVKKYEFQYGYDLYSFLKEIVETGSDGSQLNSTRFQYGNKTNSNEVIQTSAHLTSRTIPVDLDGDGQKELLVPAILGSSWQVFKYSNGDFYQFATGNAPFNFSYLVDIGYGYSIVANTQRLNSDFNGDGKEDIIFIFRGDANNIGVYLGITSFSNGNSGTLTFPSLNSQFASLYVGFDGSYLPGDYNGDGAIDLIILDKFSKSGFLLDFKNNTQTDISNISDNLNDHLNSDFPNKIIPIDFDGDGKNELLSLAAGGSGIAKVFRYDPITISFIEIYSCATGFSQLDNNTDGPILVYYAYPGDFNGDGKTDIFGATGNGAKILYFTGNGAVLADAPGNYNPYDFVVTPPGIADFNGDGKTDISYYPSIYYSIGNNDFSVQAGSVEATINADFTGDGKADGLYLDDLPILLTANKDSKERLLHHIIDGYNFKTSFTYERINNTLDNPNVYTLADNFSPAFPSQAFNGPLYVAQTLSVPDGIGGTTTTAYSYHNASRHIQGKGFLSFSKILAENNVTAISIETNYEQISGISPIIAHSVSKTKQFSIGNSTPISETTFTNSAKVYGSGRFFPFVSQAVNVNNLKNQTVTSSFLYDNDGNLTERLINYGGVETEKVENQTFSQNGSWLPYLVRTQRITKNRTEDGTDYVVNNFYDYNNNGKLTQSILFNDAALTKKLQTDYVYDNVTGNLKSATLSTPQPLMDSRITSFDYDTKGRFVTKITNPLLQVSEAEYDARWGKLIKEKSISGLVTSFQYDAFGRITKMNAPDGLQTNYSLGWAIGATVPGTGGVPLNGLVYFTNVQRPGSSPVTTWYDIYGREIKTRADGFNQPVNAVKLYNAKGQLEIVSSPFFDGDFPEIKTYLYELTGLKTGLLKSVTSTEDGIVTYGYSNPSSGKFKTSITNSAGQNSSQTTDASDKVVSAEDNNGTTLTYAYSRHGQLKDVIMGGQPLASMIYDDYGRQIELNDPNAGKIEFEYNAYGELETQKDFLNHFYEMKYDRLGRIVTRKCTAESTTPTVWDYYLTGGGINQVKSITGPNGIIQNFTYDALGRAIEIKEVIEGNNYITGYQYNALGNLSKITYPSGFAIDKEYNANGYLTKVKNQAMSKPILEILNMNAFGQYTQYKQSNTLTDKTYNSFGMPVRTTAGNFFDLENDWSITTGNLTSRTDHINNDISETFDYDDLNRLTSSYLTVNGITEAAGINISYYPNGNIQNKSRIGSYSYDGAKLNAVEQVGNPAGDISLATQDITYTPFNKTKTVTENYDVLTITYGPDHQRKKTEINNGTTVKSIIYSGNYEKITDETRNIYEVHYIICGPGLVGMAVKENGGTVQMFNVYTDHLGSIIKVRKDDGASEYEQNFDAWGQKRNPADWSYTENTQTAPPWLIRGFTGHEHLDEFSLINMNGRVYDPLLGRFNSTDNFVQNPLGTQDYNRYSYANNNPLVFTDPTGNEISVNWEGRVEIPEWMQNMYRSVMNWLGNDVGINLGDVTPLNDYQDNPTYDSPQPGYSEYTSEEDIGGFYSRVSNYDNSMSLYNKEANNVQFLNLPDASSLFLDWAEPNRTPIAPTIGQNITTPNPHVQLGASYTGNGFDNNGNRMTVYPVTFINPTAVRDQSRGFSQKAFANFFSGNWGDVDFNNYIYFRYPNFGSVFDPDTEEQKSGRNDAKWIYGYMLINPPSR